MSADEQTVANGQMTQLPNEVYDKALREIIKNNFGDNECEIECSAGSEKGDNYIGVVYRVKVTNKKSSEKLALIVKLPPADLVRREQFYVRPCFLRESKFYEEVLPLYEKFQNEKGIKEGEGFHHAPICLKSMTGDPHEALFFEDLKSKGFEMYDRFKDLTKDHVLLTMKALGKMHAVYFCIKDQQPETLGDLPKIVDIFMQRRNDPNFSAWFEQMKKQGLEAIKDCDSKIIEKAKKLFEQSFMDILSECVSAEKAEPYAIICHGDCWNNNVMYRYDENKTPVEICLIDYQLMRYASPVCDLMYFFYSCTTKELRDEFYEEFLDIYYETLVNHIKRLGSDHEKVFPRHAFEAHLKKFGKFGLLMGICNIPLFTSKASEMPELDDLARTFRENEDGSKQKEVLNFNNMSTSSICNKRLRDLFVDMEKFGYM